MEKSNLYNNYNTNRIELIKYFSRIVHLMMKRLIIGTG